MNVPSRRGRQHSDTAGSAWLQPGSYHLAFVCPKRSCRALCPLAGGMLQKAQWETAREEGSEAAGTGRVQIHRGTWECYSYCLFVLLKALQSLRWQKAWAALNPDLNNSRMSRVRLCIAHKQPDSFTRNFTQLKSPWSSNLVWITHKEGNRSPCDWNSSWLNQTQPCWPRHKRVLYKIWVWDSSEGQRGEITTFHEHRRVNFLKKERNVFHSSHIQEKEHSLKWKYNRS